MIYFQYFNYYVYHEGDSCGRIRWQFLSILPSDVPTIVHWFTTFPSDHWTKWGGYKTEVVWPSFLFLYYLISRLVGCLHHTTIGVLRKEWVTFLSKRSSFGNIQFVLQKIKSWRYSGEIRERIGSSSRLCRHQLTPEAWLSQVFKHHHHHRISKWTKTCSFVAGTYQPGIWQKQTLRMGWSQCQWLMQLGPATLSFQNLLRRLLMMDTLIHRSVASNWRALHYSWRKYFTSIATSPHEYHYILSGRCAFGFKPTWGASHQPGASPHVACIP